MEIMEQTNQQTPVSVKTCQLELSLKIITYIIGSNFKNPNSVAEPQQTNALRLKFNCRFANLSLAMSFGNFKMVFLFHPIEIQFLKYLIKRILATESNGPVSLRGDRESFTIPRHDTN